MRYLVFFRFKLLKMHANQSKSNHNHAAPILGASHSTKSPSKYDNPIKNFYPQDQQSPQKEYICFSPGSLWNPQFQRIQLVPQVNSIKSYLHRTRARPLFFEPIFKHNSCPLCANKTSDDNLFYFLRLFYSGRPLGGGGGLCLMGVLVKIGFYYHKQHPTFGVQLYIFFYIFFLRPRNARCYFFPPTGD